MKLHELIGSARRLRVRSQPSSFGITRDASTPDYAFWDRARRGKARGLEVSGLLLKPLASKVAAHVLGDCPAFDSPSRTAADALAAWFGAHHAALLSAYEESVALGDCFAVVNADLSLTIIPPHEVEPLLADTPGEIDGWRITTQHDHTRVIDEFTRLERQRRITRDGVRVTTESYPNPTGLLPIIHIANRAGADEVFGRPEGAALIPVLHKYGEIIDAAASGNIRQGRPTPVIEKMGEASQIARFWEQFGRRETHTKPDGTTETYDVIDFDPDQLLTLGADATFKYAAPGAFMGDAETLLKLLFYLIVQHSEVPEAVWGAAIPSSRASAETQMQPFIRWVTKKRALAESWLYDLARVVLAYTALYDPRIDARVPLDIRWSPLIQEDARLRLDALQWAHASGIVDDRSTRALLASLLAMNA